MDNKRLITSMAAVAVFATICGATGCANNASNGTPPQPPKSAPLTAAQIQAIKDNPNIPANIKDQMLKGEQGTVTASTPPPGFGPPKPAN